MKKSSELKRGGAGKPPSRQRRRGFSLTEILVVIAAVAILAALLGAAVSGSVARVRNVQCLSRMRNLGSGILLYAQDNNGELPRSLHSAAAAGKEPWAKAILPYLNGGSATADWERVFNTLYRCPVDKNRDVNIYSYALNVHFELTPDGDDYEGSPATWRRLSSVPHGTRTILLAEPRAVYYADHLMCHLWTSAKAATTAIDATRHGKTSNFLFADGHGESLPVSSTYDPAQGVNRWNPSLAGRN